MTDEIVLYDLPRRGKCTAWSANVWKTRLVLNYKKIPYRTEWIEHPNIEPKCKALGLPPSTTGVVSPYTVPLIILPDGDAVMDSMMIVEKLESLHPEPSLHLETGLHTQCGPILGKINAALIPNFMPRVPREILVDSSVDWFRASRRKAFGVELEEMEEQRGGEKAWAAAQPGFDELSRFLQEHKRDEGPFVLGSQVSYVDLLIAAVMEGMRRIGQDIFDGYLEREPRLKDLHQACRPWMENDQ